jgi:hypothetical protein
MENDPEKKEREIDLDQELIAEAFELKAGDRLQLEKKILAVSFLLDTCSGEGNEPVDGIIAVGLAAILRGAAADAARLRRQLRRAELD